MFLYAGDDNHSKRLGLKPHTTGKITLNINNQKVDIDGSFARVEKVNPNGEKFSIKLNEDRFKVQKGEYGGPYLLFSLSPQFCIDHINPDLVKGLQIEFGIFNTNWWHQNNIELTVDVLGQPEEVITIKCSQIVTGDQGASREREFIIDTGNSDDYESYMIITLGP